MAIFIGRYIFKNEEKSRNNQSNEIMQNTIVKEDTYSVKNDITIQTITEEEKISPNAILTLKRTYSECNHTIKEYSEIPDELVNLTKEELEEKKPGWKVEKFSAHEIILAKEETGKCNEHYILRECDGVIAVYKIENNEEILEETTGISVEYLTQSDKEKIKEGIKVYGREELNSVLEDYE